MPRRVMSVVAISVLALAFLPWNAAVSYLDGLRAMATMAWWRREAEKVARAARTVRPRLGAEW